MPITDRERDELRLAAQNYLRELNEAYAQFKMQGREYLQEPVITAEDYESRIREYAQLPENASTEEPEVAGRLPEENAGETKRIPGVG